MTPPSARHVLVVGGTGMLRGVVLELARRGDRVTVTGRRRERADRLAAEAGGDVEGIALDWRRAGALGRAVEAAAARRGPPALVVAWIHSTAAGGAPELARVLETARRPVRFLHVLGSAAAARPGAQPPALAALPHLAYEQVVLGFVVTDGRSRWLTDDEIAAGVLAAVDRPADRSVVGVLDPWSARP